MLGKAYGKENIRIGNVNVIIYALKISFIVIHPEFLYLFFCVDLFVLPICQTLEIFDFRLTVFLEKIKFSVYALLLLLRDEILVT